MKTENKALVVDKLRELATKVELMESGPAVGYKKAAYLKAAKAIESMEEKLQNAEQLRPIKGIGDNIIKKVQEILDTGGLEKLDSFTNDFSELLKIEGVGPVKAKELFATYGARTASDIQKLIQDGKIIDEKLALNVKRVMILGGKRIPRKEILEISAPIELHMKLECPRVIMQVAGSIRRKTETSKDIDILMCGDPGVIKEAKEKFLGYKWDLVTASGNVRIDAIVKGVAVNGWFLPRECYGSGILHCTGSGTFNESMRAIAKSQGYKLSEYGLRNRDTDEVLESWDEKKIFELLGYDFIPPEERADGSVFNKYKRSES